MFCKFCGNELPEGANFCPNCGKINEELIDAAKSEVKEESAAEPTLEDQAQMFEFENFEQFENTQPFDPNDDPLENERDALGGKILTFGILSLIFSQTCFSIVGLIFAIIGKTKIKEYQAKFNATEGRATVGKVFTNIGLGVSIGVTALLAFIFSLMGFVFLLGLLLA